MEHTIDVLKCLFIDNPRQNSVCLKLREGRTTLSCSVNVIADRRLLWYLIKVSSRILIDDNERCK